MGERLPDGLGEVGDFISTDDTDGLLRRPITGESLTAPWGTLVKKTVSNVGQNSGATIFY